MIISTYGQLKQVLRRKGYLFFGPRAYDLNVVGIRNPSQRPGKFDDTFCIAYVDANGYERVFTCPFTADPGASYFGELAAVQAWKTALTQEECAEQCALLMNNYSLS